MANLSVHIYESVSQFMTHCGAYSAAVSTTTIFWGCIRRNYEMIVSHHFLVTWLSWGNEVLIWDDWRDDLDYSIFLPKRFFSFIWHKIAPMKFDAVKFFSIVGIILFFMKTFFCVFIGGRDVLRDPIIIAFLSFFLTKSNSYQHSLPPCCAPKQKLVNEDMLIPRCVGKNKTKCVMM